MNIKKANKALYRNKENNILNINFIIVELQKKYFQTSNFHFIINMPKITKKDLLKYEPYYYLYYKLFLKYDYRILLSFAPNIEELKKQFYNRYEDYYFLTYNSINSIYHYIKFTLQSPFITKELIIEWLNTYELQEIELNLLKQELMHRLTWFEKIKYKLLGRI